MGEVMPYKVNEDGVVLGTKEDAEFVAMAMPEQTVRLCKTCSTLCCGTETVDTKRIGISVAEQWNPRHFQCPKCGQWMAQIWTGDAQN